MRRLHSILNDMPALAATMQTYDERLSYLDYLAAAGELKRGIGDLTAVLPTYRVLILRNFTIEPMTPVLAVEALRAGVVAEARLGNFDSILAEASSPSSSIAEFKPDLVLIVQWLATLSPPLADCFVSLTAAEVQAEIGRVRDANSAVLRALRRCTDAPILINNFPLPAQPTLGILDAQGPGHEIQAVLMLNADLMADCAAMHDVYVVDMMRVIARVGTEHAIDDRYWHVASAPLTRDALRALGREYGRYVRALRGTTRKCLVLDCDNTLWGGVVGEDGLGGIQLGTSYPGVCYRAFQQEILNLQRRGVLLAIASKNNEADVLSVLREHPDSILREEHFATWAISWQDKVTQLRQIANDLNVGVDSLVFVDDSPFEAQLVQQSLPEVAVLIVPKSPASLRGWLSQTGLFDSLVFSQEDRQRTAMYRVAHERQQLAANSSDLADYLSKLRIEVTIASPSLVEVGRVAQLTQKTNQFNLTTRRYTEGQIRGLLDRSGAQVLRLRVRDSISDLGLVGVGILLWNDECTVEIDTLLLSCRALGRGVEDAFLRSIARQARAQGAEMLIGRYLPTSKNGQCTEFYARNGFHLVAETPSESTWHLPLTDSILDIPEWIALTDDTFATPK